MESHSPSKAKRPRMSQRRRTKSERNRRAGKVTNVPVEESVALDAEIDKFLEEKAIKNNLTATNVKSIIRHVITNNMVQKMIMSTGKKKGNKEDGDNSSDDETYFEPKLTRGRTKLLLGDKQSTTPLWPLAASSSKKSKNKEISETHVLIHEELPEECSGDDEYFPSEEPSEPVDILELHSDDENSSVISHTSDANDAGSPRVTAGGGGTASRRRRSCDVTQRGGGNDSASNCKRDTMDNLFLFKTPPPVKPKCKRRIDKDNDDNAIGRRTRSKLPLNDTTLEDLERQLIPPDITPGMYDWNADMDEDYLKFVNDFLRPSQNNEAGDDDEADPEYNVMEDEEEHDKEELRMDRAVKVSKKELNGLVEELLEESHFTSGDELDQDDFSFFCISQLSNHMPMTNVQNFTQSPPQTSTVRIEEIKDGTETTVTLSVPSAGNSEVEVGKKGPSEIHFDDMARTVAEAMISLAETNTTVSNVAQTFQVPAHPCPQTTPVKPANPVSIVVEQGQQLPPPTAVNESLPDPPSGLIPQTISVESVPPTVSIISLPQPEPESDLNWFSKETLEALKYQMIQHIQLMSQSYVLTASRDDPFFKNIAYNSKRMINEIKNLSRLNGPKSNFLVVNLEPAWQLVNSWPVKSPPKPKSPLKTKKILEEKYMNDHRNEEGYQSGSSPVVSEPFPRDVVQVIGESRAFVYPDLLPQYYTQNSTAPLHFVPSEDILLVYGLEDLRDAKFNSVTKCKLISETLLVTRTPSAVFNRYKNLKKASNTKTITKSYFLHEKLPPAAPPPPKWNRSYARSIMSQPHERTPNLWIRLLSMLLKPASAWKPHREAVKKQRKLKPRKKKSKKNDQSSPENQVIVTSTFPAGTGMAQQKIEENPDLAAFPILNSNGDPGAYMFIPKYALTAPGCNNSPKGTETEANTTRKYYQPVPLYKFETENGQQTSPSGNEDNSMVDLTPVGKPFSISGVDIQNDVVCLESLGTPLKRAIMEHIQDPQAKSSTGSPVRIHHSARTVGNYVLGSAKKDYPSTHDGPSSSSSSSSSSDNENHQQDLEVEEDDVNLTEYEDNLNTGSPLPSSITEIVILPQYYNVDENNVVYYEISTPINVTNVSKSGGTKQSSNDTQGDKENSGDGKSGQRSENYGNQQESTSTVGGGTAPTRSDQGSSGSGSGDKGDEDENNKRRPRKNTCPTEISENAEKDKEEDTEVTEDEPDTSGGHSIKGKMSKKQARHLKSRNQRIPKHPAGRSPHKRSPGMASTAPKKRSSKSVPIEKMLEEDKQRDIEVCDAFMHAFLSKVQSSTEKTHPGLHNEFLKLLADAGENNESQPELLLKIQNLLKDYPELIREFSTFVESEDLDESMPPSYDSKFEDCQELQAQLNFIRLLEKFTEKSPQLKTKILHKFKVLKEEPDLSERDVAEGLAPFFQGNPVMLDAFKALFPSVYRPQSIDPEDFEEIDLEADEPQQNVDTELVKLPEEKTIPATNSCPCHCHENATHSYTSRVKHCNKCCIKDGKVFVHNGRVVRPVNVELTSPTAARKIISGNSCINCVPEPSTSKLKDCTHTTHTPSSSSSSKLKDESDPKKAKLETVPSVKPVLATEKKEVEEGEIVDEEEVNTNKGQDNNMKLSKDTSVASTSKSVTEERGSETKASLNKPWTIEEDRVILATVQSEGKFEDAFRKLASQLKQRDITEIESRCVELLSLLQQSMNAAAHEEEDAEDM